MRVLMAPFVALFLAAALADAEAPLYSSDSIVNSADNQPGPLAPNSLATIYGKNLAYSTKALTADDVKGGVLPTVLPGTGVRVLVANILANPIYVSPSQINLLVPPNLIPGTVNVSVVVDSWAGPAVPVQISSIAPALFQLDEQNAIATHADGSLVTPGAPAKPGDTIVLYATGLGQTAPPVLYGILPASAASLAVSGFVVLLDGVPVDPGAILYAGVCPGFTGLYQINLTLPSSAGPNPQISIGFAGTLSPPVSIPVQP